jgi:hypothetical protein
VLTIGATGARVRELQARLLELAYDLGVAGADGIFGRKTEWAVRVFQRSQGLVVDGVVGRKTWAALAAPRPGPPPVPYGQGELRVVFGDLHLRMGPNPGEACYLRIGGDWEARSMMLLAVSGLPALRRLYCHRKLAPVLTGAFEEIATSGLAAAIRTFDGCFCPRYKRRTSRDLPSVHCWGIALDLNARTNQQGTHGDMSPALIAVFRKHGFKWGGDWRGRYRDPMHFQYCMGY